MVIKIGIEESCKKYLYIVMFLKMFDLDQLSQNFILNISKLLWGWGWSFIYSEGITSDQNFIAFSIIY